MDAAARHARRYVGVAAAGFAALAAYVLAQDKPPFFDETYYLTLAQRLPAASSFKTWLLENDQGPTGPVHALMHHVLSGGHGSLPAPWFRLPNLVLLAATIALTAALVRRLGHAHSGMRASAIMAVPMAWVMSGLALTEMPAMCGFAAAMLAATRLGESETPPTRTQRWSGAALIALGTGVALCGRQTYLAVLPAVLCAGWGPYGRGATAAGVAAGLLPALALFATWGGMVPPKLAEFVAGQGLRPRHALYAVCYVGLISALLAPALFRQRPRWALAGGTAAAAAAVVFGPFTLTTLSSAQRFLGSPAVARALEWTVGQLFIAAGGAFVAVLAVEVWARRSRSFLAHAGGVLLLCGACAGVTHQFSSRYIGMALPLWIPLLAPWIVPTRGAVLRLLAGMAAGAAALHSYYAAH